MKKLLFAAAALCFIIASCKKNEGGDSTPKTRADTLTTGSWALSAMNASFKNPFTNTDTTVDLYANMEECARDDRYIFLANGRVTNDQSVKKCDSTGPQQMDGGTWSLSADKSALVMTDGILPGNSYKIAAFSNSAMQLQADSTIAGLVPIRVLATFTHQQ